MALVCGAGRDQMWALRATYIMRPISASYVHCYTCSRYLQRYMPITHTQQIVRYRRAYCYTRVHKRRYMMTGEIRWGGFTASVMRVHVWKEEDYILTIDAYCNVSEQGNWSSHIWHVHRRLDLCHDQRMSVPHGVWLDMFDRYIDMPMHARRDRSICSTHRD